MSRIQLSLFSVALLAALPQRAVWGQEPGVSTAPARQEREVRVTSRAAGLDRRRGIFRGVRDSTLLLQAGPGPLVQVPVNQIDRLELLIASKTASSTGMKIGMLAGLAIGVGVGVAAKSSCDSDPDSEPAICSVWLLGGPLAGVAVGALGGTLLGSARRTETWREVPVSALPVAVSPVRGGMRVGLTLKF